MKLKSFVAVVGAASLSAIPAQPALANPEARAYVEMDTGSCFAEVPMDDEGGFVLVGALSFLGLVGDRKRMANSGGTSLFKCDLDPDDYFVLFSNVPGPYEFRNRAFGNVNCFTEAEATVAHGTIRTREDGSISIVCPAMNPGPDTSLEFRSAP